MIHIIKSLDSNELMDLGLTYDGYYWGNDVLPFKLIKSSEEGTYMVHIENAGIGQTPDPVKNNSQLLRLMMQFAGLYIQKRLQESRPDSPDALIIASSRAVSEYFKFPNGKYKFVPQIQGQGIGIIPATEETINLVEGVEAEFRVRFKDGTEDYLFASPGIMSYDFIKRIFNGSEPEKVYVKWEEGEWKPFFGIGIGKVEGTKTPTSYS